jgi:putative ABC transport system permease protein
MMGEFQFERILILGLKSLWLHKLRSLLTVLAIVFGVCSVIAMLAISEGAHYEAQEQIKQLGSTNIILRTVKPPQEGPADIDEENVQYGLTYEDAKRIATTIPGVSVTVPARHIPTEAWVTTRHANVVITGTVPWFPRIMNRQVAQGRFLTSTDVYYANNVCVLEQGVAAVLFPVENPIGRNIRVNSDYYCVVGLMAPASNERPVSATSEGEGAGSEVYIPLTAARARFGAVTYTTTPHTPNEYVQLHEIDVGVTSVGAVIETASVCRETMARFHKKADYEIVVPLELLRAVERTKRIYGIVLGSVAAISLLVGGIGIMNIMLSSVTERTREIGIRRALGAKKRHITVQFLTETVLLSGSGGLCGVLLGVAIPSLVEYFAGMKTIVTGWSVALAFSISVAVGIIFGLYPAYRAANMDPIEALRNE